MYLDGFTWIQTDLHGSTETLMDLHVFKWIYMDLSGFTWICYDWDGISEISVLGDRAACGSLWQAVAACGETLWSLYNTMLRPWGWQAGSMVAGWLNGWMEMMGITAVTYHAGRLEGSADHLSIRCLMFGVQSSLLVSW